MEGSHPQAIARSTMGRFVPLELPIKSMPAVFLVMELVEGSTLRDFLNQQGSVSIEQMFQLMSPVLSALAAAHKIGIIHRDIKPENILISKDGRVKVADFGLARNMAIGQTMTVESSVVLGSVSYLSPEQVQRGVADARSDIYAVGIVLFEMLVPFSSNCLSCLQLDSALKCSSLMAVNDAFNCSN